MLGTRLAYLELKQPNNSFCDAVSNISNVSFIFGDERQRYNVQRYWEALMQ